MLSELIKAGLLFGPMSDYAISQHRRTLFAIPVLGGSTGYFAAEASRSCALTANALTQ